jgi:hypothetical protein
MIYWINNFKEASILKKRYDMKIVGEMNSRTLKEVLGII